MYIATTQQVDKAKEVIRKLTFDFQSESFENPGMYVCMYVYICHRVGRLYK